MGYFEAVLLGVVQGLTEFLPVSSSGHLAIVQYFLDMKGAMENVTFDVFLHLATVLAVIWVYRSDIGKVFTGKSVGEGENPVPTMKLIGLLALSIIATGIAIPFKDQLENMFVDMKGVGIQLIINGIMLAVLPLLKHENKGLGQLTWVGALVIGLAQAVSVIPAISRSGATIIAGLLFGLSPREACRYSFLLSIPSVLLAGVVQIPDALDAGFSVAPGPLVAGFAVALVCGLLAIPLLVGIVEKGKLWGFAIYCGIVGAALLVIAFMRG